MFSLLCIQVATWFNDIFTSTGIVQLFIKTKACHKCVSIYDDDSQSMKKKFINWFFVTSALSIMTALGLSALSCIHYRLPSSDDLPHTTYCQTAVIIVRLIASNFTRTSTIICN